MGTVTRSRSEARSSRCRYAFRWHWASWSTRRRKGLLVLSVGVGLGVLAERADGRSEVRLRRYEYFGDRDPLSRAVLERMLAGVSTRRYRRTQDPVGQEVEQQARSTSHSSVSRTFMEHTRRSLGELMGRRLDDIPLAVMMIDGIDLGERTNVVPLGITTEGVKILLGLWEGSTENASMATSQPRRPAIVVVP